MEVKSVQQTNHAHSKDWDEQLCLQGCVRNQIIYQEKMYKHFYPTMMALVHRYTTDKDVATSILNNGFLKVFKHIHQFEGRGSLEGWIRRIIVHAVSDYFRHKKTVQEVSYDLPPDNPSTYILPASKYDYTILLQCLQKLPPSTRVVVNLFIIEQCTHREIAKMLGISENTSKWHVAEGRKILATQLSSYIAT